MRTSLDILRSGKEQWNSHFDPIPQESRAAIADFRGADLSNLDLSGYNLQNAKFSSANLKGTKFNAADLKSASFFSIQTDQETSFKKSNLTKAYFNDAHLNGCNMEEIIAHHTSFQRTAFISVNLKKADLNSCALEGASFLKTNLEGVSFRLAILAQTKWEDSSIDKDTNFYLANFTKDHDALSDKSDMIRFKKVRSFFNWKTTRSIGKLPIFEFSWVVFLIALFVINTIGMLNETQLITSIKYDIPIPDQMFWIIISSLCLVIGSSIYKWKCPRRIQEFSETLWVEEHNRPRHFYLSECLKSPNYQIATTVLLLFGGCIGLILVGLRVLDALHYSFRTFNPF